MVLFCPDSSRSGWGFVIQLAVIIWGKVVLEYVSSAACPEAAANPLWALGLHWLYLTVADWCTEQCAENTEKRLPHNSLPMLPRCASLAKQSACARLCSRPTAVR